jgi:hypothetical protein
MDFLPSPFLSGPYCNRPLRNSMVFDIIGVLNAMPAFQHYNLWLLMETKTTIYLDHVCSTTGERPAVAA